MAPYESEEDDRRRDRFPRGDRERNGGAPPDPYERRREGGGFKRSYGGPRREDDAKRARTENDLMEPMQSLRQYAQEHDIPLDSEELPEKYANYQDGYYKRLYKQFFDNHKTEEWFKNKYHPLNRSSISTQQKLAVQKRLDAYNLLKSRGLLEGPFLRPENARQIVRLMTAVIHILDGEGEETIDKILRLEIPDIAVEDVMKFGMALAEESDMVSDPALLERPGAILIRSVPAATTAEELEEVCQRSPGFLRLHFFEAIPETKFTRKAIATYKNTVDLKDVCWSISNVKAKGGDLIASVFNESTDRVRISHPLINHKECTQHILHKAARILAFLDRKAGFFVLDSEASIEEFLKDVSIGVDFVSASQNPLVQKIRAAIPGSLDDDETMQRQKTTPDSADCLFERDESLISLLDEVTFYLRVVYSFDLLNYHFFDDEDTLPCRFSVMHIRGQDPVANEQGLTIFKMGALRIFTEEMNRRLDAITSVSCLSNEKMTAYGALNPEDAVEELIKTNTVQLSEEKWLCPLSGKKFKGPEFIRKHIMSKHSEHADAAKAESTFFNNYLFDTNRPTDKVEEPPEYRSMDPRGGFNRDRRRLPPRRDDRSPRKEPFRELPPPIRRPHLAYKDLDAAPDMEVANVF